MELAAAILRVIVSLAFILWLTYWSLRVLLPRLQAGRQGFAGNMEIIDRLAVGTRNNVCLIRVGEKIFLIGISTGNIRLLAEIPLSSLSKSSDTLPESPDFAGILRNSTEKVKQTLDNCLRHNSNGQDGD